MAKDKVKSKIDKKIQQNLEKDIKKKVKDSKKPSKEPKKDTNNEQERKDEPRSAKLVHQFIPFLLFALAVLLAVCILGAEAFDADMGILGNFISSVFCGLFGWGAFLVPIILVYMGATWVKSVDSNRVKLKMIFSVISMLLVSVTVHVFCTLSVPTSFNVVELWKRGVALTSGGLLGGIISDILVALFKQWGTIIITLSCLFISLMFIFNITPKNVWTYIKYKNKLRIERKREKELMAAQNKENEEAVSAEKETVKVIAKEPEPTSEPSTEEERKTILRARKREQLEAEIEEKKAPADPAKRVILNTEPDDDDGVRLGEIFDNDDNVKRDKDGIISIDLSSGKDEAPKKKAPAVKTEEVKDESKKGGDVVLSMKVDTETLSELESLRGDEGEAVELKKSYVYPPSSLLHADTNPKGADVSEEMNENAAILRETLASFNIGVKDQILCSRGPTITRYELRPEVGVRVRSIANLVDDISLSLATSGVRIEAPIPNKPYVGIEVPNRTRLTVFLRSLIEDTKFVNDPSKLLACLGSDVGGHPVFFDITKMPHLLIAGATGMGKSVCINSIIMSILYRATPDEVKLILIDPKKVEFNIYKDIPHLYAPIVSDPKKAAGALASAVAEMERRFELIEDVGVRDINNYNAVTADDPDREYLPKMVIIIDELADLMMTAPGEVESSICRLAQKARAAGIHIIIGTQRPSVDVITGLIKANVPSRIACTVASQVDSRTIIDIAGAEKLIGRGDMLFAPVGISKPMRVQGAFVSDAEVEAVVEFIKANNNKAEYNKDFISIMESEAAKCGNNKKGGGAEGGDSGEGGDSDPKFREAVKLAIDAGKISTSLMQRMLGVGYGRAAKIIDRMEALGYVSAPDGNKPRQVLITMQEYMEKVINDDIGGDGEPSSDDGEE